MGVADGQQGGGQQAHATVEQVAAEQVDGDDAGGADDAGAKQKSIQIGAEELERQRRQHVEELWKLEVADTDPDRSCAQGQRLASDDGDVAVNVAGDRGQIPDAQHEGGDDDHRQQRPFPPDAGGVVRRGAWSRPAGDQQRQRRG